MPPKTFVPPARGPSVLHTGAPSGRPQGSIANAPSVGSSLGDAQTKTEIKTYFTDADGLTKIIYNGDRLWAKVTLVLETAGPVAVGNMQNIAPVLSGKGELLETGVPLDFVIAKGTRLYIASTSINRVKLKIEPLPWLEQLTGTVGLIAAGVSAFVSKFITGGK